MRLKYFIRGLGTGILATALILFIGSRFIKPTQLSDAEIIQQAQKLGMVTEEEAKLKNIMSPNSNEQTEGTENADTAENTNTVDNSVDDTTDNNTDNTLDSLADNTDKNLAQGDTDDDTEPKADVKTDAAGTNNDKSAVDNKESETDILNAEKKNADKKEDTAQVPTNEKTDKADNTEKVTDSGTDKKNTAESTTKGTNTGTDKNTTADNENNKVNAAAQEEAKKASTAKDNSEESVAAKTDYISIEIKAGTYSSKVSERLLALGLIDDAKKFDSYLIKNGYQYKIRVGTYKIQKGSTYAQIAKKITRQ